MAASHWKGRVLTILIGMVFLFFVGIHVGTNRGSKPAPSVGKGSAILNWTAPPQASFAFGPAVVAAADTGGGGGGGGMSCGMGGGQYHDNTELCPCMCPDGGLCYCCAPGGSGCIPYTCY